MCKNSQNDVSREASAKAKSFAERQEAKKPSENEMIIFKDLFQRCVGENTSLEMHAMPRLEGFYQLIKDNPRIRPLSLKQSRAWIVSHGLLSQTCYEVEKNLNPDNWIDLLNYSNPDALLTMPDAYTAVLADAAELPDNRLWFFEVFDESNQNEHTLDLEYERGEDNGYWITLHSARGILASIGPTEVSDETSALWKAWQQHLTTDDGHYAARAIAGMKQAALDWNN